MEEIVLKEDERIDDLEFKGLNLIQNTNGCCFGVDAVLLSDFAKGIKKGANVVDIGTGTGIISILLCGKTNLNKIYAIELQEEVAEMASNGMARTIRPINTSMDGDSVYALCTGKVKSSADVVGTLAAHVLAKAINRAVLETTEMYGYKSAQNFINK